jgi:hypothetical protein
MCLAYELWRPPLKGPNILCPPLQSTFMIPTPPQLLGSSPILFKALEVRPDETNPCACQRPIFSLREERELDGLTFLSPEGIRPTSA